MIAKDVAFVRYGAPDLALMERFLHDFGMHTVRRTETRLYMRGAGTQPFVHVTELADLPTAIGFGILAQSAEDLAALAARFGVAVEDSAEPGGGQVVRLADPQGTRIEVVHGFAALAPLPTRAPLVINPSSNRGRFGEKQRPKPGPSHVMRLGHVVLKVVDLPASYEFYTSVFGMKVSDSYWAGSPENRVAAFLHFGLGQQYTDHHSVALIKHPGDGFEHTAFEVLDWDDLSVGSQHLEKAGYRHSWGVGRHVQGSQIFDYWRDPFGNKIEHWTDGDLVNDNYVTGDTEVGPDALSQWGPAITEDFMK